MSRRTAVADDNIDSMSIPVAIDGIAEGSGEWPEKYAVGEAVLRSPEADTYDELLHAVTRPDGDIAAHYSRLLNEPNRRAVGFALGGVLVGGLIGAAVVAALHARKR